MEEEKTAQELVDELMDETLEDSWNWKQYTKLKAAIKREQDATITMHPISELPHKVPKGCVIAQLNIEHIVGLWYDDDETVVRNQHTTHFYILPLPKPERKLKPCPWCGARPVAVRLLGGVMSYCHIIHDPNCPISDATAIPADKADAWGWE